MELLKKTKYQIKVHQHDALFTVEESKKLRGKMDGAHSKNLFLKNKKNQFFLISCEEHNQINLKKISKSLNLGNISFANKEYLLKYLGVNPGSVSPFALLNDKNNDVGFFLDTNLIESYLINFHPLINTLTITMPTQEFIKFMIENNKKIHIFSSEEGKVIRTYE